MKNLICLLALLCIGITTSLQAQDAKAVPTSFTVEETAAVSWDAKVFEFGEIPQNIPAVAEFMITNNSDKPLIIQSAKGSCGCTVPNYSDQPIPSGESTTITATYNAKKKGNFQKNVTVKTNLSDQPTVLKIKGTVLEKKDQLAVKE